MSRRGTAYLEFQVNPTNVGHRYQSVELYDGRDAARAQRTHCHDLSLAVDIVPRATVAFLFIYVLLRVIGRRELSTQEPFDVILLVVRRYDVRSQYEADLELVVCKSIGCKRRAGRDDQVRFEDGAEGEVHLSSWRWRGVAVSSSPLADDDPTSARSSSTGS